LVPSRHAKIRGIQKYGCNKEIFLPNKGSDSLSTRRRKKSRLIDAIGRAIFLKTDYSGLK